MIRKTVAARTRHVEKVSVGDLVFFYRCHRSVKALKQQAQRGCYLGPAVVIGHQRSNAWVSYAGRCYLVAPEHIRTLAPDGYCSTKPHLRAGLEELRKLDGFKEDTIDITQQSVTPAELATALDTPAGNDHDPIDVEQLPVPETNESGQPIQELTPHPEEQFMDIDEEPDCFNGSSAYFL